MLKVSRQKISGHEPVGPGIGPQLRCLALPLSTAEKRFEEQWRLKPARLQRQREGPGPGKGARRKIGGHEPVGLGIGPQPGCIALPLSAVEQCFGGSVEAKTSPIAEKEMSAACTSAGDARCDPAEERRMWTGEYHSRRAVLPPSGEETVFSPYIRQG
ncbi:hypothetical protein NDU88_008327 [Pleurodeles waltl]|uniref:Uncharacterized protein n=1 Tax=Pleurodeles waltl TaxID=8319 RepID=A0AAV7NZ12_PLEWA|nr:hypothetical protein NDU88_008327 [Pleurodeles waltl]